MPQISLAFTSQTRLYGDPANVENDGALIAISHAPEMFAIDDRPQAFRPVVFGLHVALASQS
jgi:hypothetical protein